MKRRSVLPILLIILGSVCVSAQTPPGTGQIDLDLARSREEFRWGVGAFHESRFADAIVAFTRALSFKPDNVLSREWLGRAYFHSGLVDAALAEWQRVADESGAYLANRIDTITFRRGLADLAPPPTEFAVSTEFEGNIGDSRLFRRPAGVAASSDGTIYVTSMATHEVLHINANGFILNRFQGGLAGMDLPFDIMLRDDGSLVVSEFGADKISILSPSTGNRQLAMGSSGLGDGELLGPQYLTADETGALYVSEWGGRRVSKFSATGDFLLTLGERGPLFAGFSGPTGVQWRNGIVWVADNSESGPILHRFDESGNYIDSVELPVPRETVIEDIEADARGRFLLAAGSTILLYDPDNEAIVAELPVQGMTRATSAAEDANHRITVSDFDGEQVILLSPSSALYSGLDVRINRVVSREFPRVSVELSVSDRFGRPVVGMDAGNFIASENGVPLSEVELLSAGHTVETLESAIVVDTALGGSAGAVEGAVAALRDTYRSMSLEDTLRLYVTDSDPQRIIELPASEERFADALGSALPGTPALPPDPEVAIRLAAVELANRDIRRHLFFVTPGVLSDEAFLRYGIEEIANLLVNNGIEFSILLTEQRTPDLRLQYLVDESGGLVRYIYEPAGIAPTTAALRKKAIGTYWISYQSVEDTDFGRAYIPLSVEVRLEIRSGRDEAGYFGPSR